MRSYYSHSTNKNQVGELTQNYCVLTTCNSQPFGMLMPNRHGSVDEYRYQFNGMESDPEVKGEGNSYTTEFRQYDPRLGRWLSLDPLMAKYPNMSPYVAFNNNPIYYNDPKGLEGETSNDPSVDTPSDKNPTVIDIVTYADIHRGSVNLGWVLATLYHESKFKQFNAIGTPVKSGEDYGIGQVNQKWWSGSTELKDQGIDVVDFDKVKKDWKYNIEVSTAIMEKRTKRVQEKHGNIGWFDKFIAMYAMYNGGPNGYNSYLNGTGAGEDIEEHIDGKNGLVDDLDGLLNVLEQEFIRVNDQWNDMTREQQLGDEGKKVMDQSNRLEGAMDDVRRLIGHKSRQSKPRIE